MMYCPPPVPAPAFFVCVFVFLVLCSYRRLLSLLEKHPQLETKKRREPDPSIDSPSTQEEVKTIPLIFPPPKLCTDNGVMIAWAGVEKLLLGISNGIEDQEPLPRWPLGIPITRIKNSPPPIADATAVDVVNTVSIDNSTSPSIV
jgi:hypothetical protein